MSPRTVQLGEVAQVERNAASDTDCQTMPYVGLEHIEKDSGHFTDDFRPKPQSLLATKFKFTSRHVLYGKLRPYLNKVALPYFDGVCTTEILPLLPKDGVLERGFLYGLLLSSGFVNWASQHVSGANLPRVDPSLLEEFTFELPSLSEQQLVAGQFEHADRLRRTRRFALELSDTFLPAAFLKLFGDLKETAARYEQTAFGELVDSTQLGLVRGAAEMHHDFAYEYLRMDSILGDGSIDFSNLRRVQATPEEARDFSLRSGDFLFNTRNSRDLVGKTGLVTTPPKTCLFNNNIMRVRFHNTITSEFMMGLFQAPWLKDNLERIKSGTTSVFAIYYKELADLPIVVPPLTMQREFTSLVERHERLRAGQREALRQAEHLFQSLLHRAFTIGL